MKNKNKGCCCENRVCLCSSDGVLGILSKKWTMCIINHLGEREEGYRFNELEGSVEGISPKSLSSRLKDLKREGLVEREVKDSRPPEVRYRLTKDGKKLDQKLKPLIKWIHERR